MSVSNLALHPKKSILATASDDATWKMWDLPSGDLIMVWIIDWIVLTGKHVSCVSASD